MERKTLSHKGNENGSYDKIEKVKQVPKDGFVEHQPGEYRKGYGLWFEYETDDPKKKRPFVYIFMTVFILIWILIFGYLIYNAQNLSFYIYGGCILVGGVLFCLYGLKISLKRIKEIEIQQREKAKNSQNKKA